MTLRNRNRKVTYIVEPVISERSRMFRDSMKNIVYSIEAQYGVKLNRYFPEDNEYRIKQIIVEDYPKEPTPGYSSTSSPKPNSGGCHE